MKTLLGENPGQYNTAVLEAMRRVDPLQTALDAYTTLGIATVPTLAELNELQDSPRAFLVKMMTNRQPLSLVGGITVSADKFYDMLNKPAGSEEFVATVKSLFNGPAIYVVTRVDATQYELVAGQLVLAQAVKDLFREQSRTYATTQAQVDEWTQIQAIAAALNTIRQMPRFGVQFNAVTYLQGALVATENLRQEQPAAGNPQYVVRGQ